MVIVDSDGTEFEVSRHLKPLNNREERTNRLKMKVKETETQFLFSLVKQSIVLEKDLEQPLHALKKTMQLAISWQTCQCPLGVLILCIGAVLLLG